jgi:YbgC/YbaW family acyl-CoA thioester hydrolase
MNSGGKIFKSVLNPIRLGEFDLGGVLFHANYFHLLEELREKFLAACGTPYSSLVSDNSHLAIAESQQKFILPIRYGETVSGELWFEEVGRASLSARYILTVEGERPALVHTATTKLVFVSAKTGALAVAPLPVKLRSIFVEYSAMEGDA